MPSLVLLTFVAIWMQVLQCSRVSAKMFVNAAELCAVDWTLPHCVRYRAGSYKLLGTGFLCHISRYDIWSLTTPAACIFLTGKFFQTLSSLVWFTFAVVRAVPVLLTRSMSFQWSSEVLVFGHVFGSLLIVWQQTWSKVIDVILASCAVYLWMQKWKNYYRWFTSAKVIMYIKVAN